MNGFARAFVLGDERLRADKCENFRDEVAAYPSKGQRSFTFSGYRA